MVAFALLLLLTPGQAAPTPGHLQGADKIIAAMGGAEAADPLGPAAAKKVEARIKAFGAICDQLPPADAAAKWFELFEEAGKPWKSSIRSWQPAPNALGATGALPPPAAWPALRTLIYAKTKGLKDRRSIQLRLFAELLNNDQKAAEASIVSLLNPTSGDQRDDALTAYTEWAEGSGDRELLNRAFAKMVDAVAKHSAVNDNWEGLPELLGEAKATEVFQKLLDIDPTLLDGIEGPASRKIILKLLLEQGSKLSKPLWRFANRLDAAALYPVFAKRWPAEPAGQPTDEEQVRYSAKICYALSLELAGKHAEAVGQADDIDWLPGQYGGGVYEKAALEAGVAQAYYRLMAGVAGKHLDKVEWGSILSAAEASGHADEALELLRRRLASGTPASSEEDSALGDYIDGLLASDKVELAISEIHRLMSRAEEYGPNYSSQWRFSEDLVRIGQVTGRSDLIEQGLAAVRKVRPDWLMRDDGEDRPSHSLVLLRVSRGGASTVEDDFVKSVADSHKQYLDAKSGKSNRFGIIPNPYYPQNLLNLVHLYWVLDRPNDVVDLFEKSPAWGASDLAEIQDQSRFSRRPGPNVGFYAAWALCKTGEKAKAAEVITDALHENLNFDPAFEVLVNAKGLVAIPVLDELSSRNPGVARPLIWKAVALHAAHQDKEAEATIRQAIALDPCDGNAWYDQWQKAYSVLADIRAAQGDQADADSLRRKVQAATLLEHGDDLVECGLTTRSISAYTDAAALWPDSALIQIKLGMQLEAMGQADEAAKHYGVGFDLLPDQLGRRDPARLEFDKLFVLPIAARIAEASLTKRFESTRKSPEAQYILARLCLARDRRVEALKHLVAAIEADPTYLPAAERLEEENRELIINPTEADRIGLAMSRLDPDHNRFPEGSTVMNTIAIYNAAYAAAQKGYQPPSHLWRLEASAREVAASGSDERKLLGYDDEIGAKIDPREVAASTVSETRFLRWVIDWLSKGGAIDDEYNCWSEGGR